MCLTVNEFGVIVQHQWSREVITWGEVAEIAVLCDLLKPNPKNDTLNNRSSRSRNERVVVLDGFERKGVLREIVIIRHSDPTRPFFVEPTSRFALEALQAGLQWQMDNFDRPLRLFLPVIRIEPES